MGKNFYDRCPPEDRPVSFRDAPHPEVSLEKSTSQNNPRPSDIEASAGGDKGSVPKYDSSLLLAVNQTFFRQFWTAGVFQLLAGSFLLSIFRRCQDIRHRCYNCRHSSRHSPTPRIFNTLLLPCAISGIYCDISSCWTRNWHRNRNLRHAVNHQHINPT